MFEIFYFTSSGVDTLWKGSTAVGVSSKRQRQNGMNKITQISKWLQVVPTPFLSVDSPVLRPPIYRLLGIQCPDRLSISKVIISQIYIVSVLQ